jgi:hypothetical protein
MFDMYTLDQPGPEGSVRGRLAAALAGGLGSSGNHCVPLVRLGPELEQRRRKRIADLHGSDLDAEEPNVTLGEIIQPIEGLTVLLPEVRRHPDDGGSFGPGRVREKLAKVPVIGRGELVLDNEHAVIGLIPPD